jgi:hypothetical protein
VDQLQVSLTDIWGVQWALTRGAPGRPGVYLMGPVGLASPIEVTARATTSQVGVTPVGWKAEHMETTWDLGFRGDDEPLLEVWSLFLRGLSPLQESTLRVTLPSRGTLSCPLVRTSEDPEPEKSPATPGLPSLQVQVPVTSWQGCWHGETVAHRGESVVANAGDLPAWPTIRWSGSGASVTAPGIGKVPLPDAGDRVAVLETDPAVAARVRVGGVDAPDLWRGMRGRLFPLSVPGFGTARWSFDGCVGYLTSRHSHMWRW